MDLIVCSSRAMHRLKAEEKERSVEREQEAENNRSKAAPRPHALSLDSRSATVASAWSCMITERFPGRPCRVHFYLAVPIPHRVRTLCAATHHELDFRTIRNCT